MIFFSHKKITKNIAISVAIFSFTVFASAEVLARQIVTTEVKLAKVLTYQKKYDEALSYYDKHLKKHPADAVSWLESGDVAFWDKKYDSAIARYDKAAQFEETKISAEKKRAEVLVAEGKFASAGKSLETALEADPNDADAQLSLARTLSYQNKFSSSVAAYDKVLALRPNDADAMLGKAEVLSWMADYDLSVKTYDQLLALRYDWKNAREKARVLGWAKKFRLASKAYDDTFERSGEEVVQLEKQAKEKFWNRRPLAARKKYQALLEKEPSNVEARFDLGQIEGFEGMLKDARSDFQKIISEFPNHFMAKSALTKVDTALNKRNLEPDFYWLKALSDSRDAHLDMISTGLKIRQPLGEHFGLSAGYRFDHFFFTSFKGVDRNRVMAGFDASLNPYFKINAEFRPAMYSYSKRVSYLFGATAIAKPVDGFIIKAAVDKDDLIINRTVFNNQTQTTNFGGALQYDATRRVTLYGDYTYGALNDSNRRNAFGFEGIVIALEEPKRLSIDLRFDYYNYKFTTTNYFSPQNFVVGTATIHWRQYFNPNGIYYGSLNRYYGVKYKFSMDRDKKVFNGGEVELLWEFSHIFSVNADVFANYSTVYYDAGAKAGFAVRF